MDLDVKGSGRRHVVSQATADVFVCNGKKTLGKISGLESYLIDVDCVCCVCECLWKKVNRKSES